MMIPKFESIDIAGNIGFFDKMDKEDDKETSVRVVWLTVEGTAYRLAHNPIPGWPTITHIATRIGEMATNCIAGLFHDKAGVPELATKRVTTLSLENGRHFAVQPDGTLVEEEELSQPAKQTPAVVSNVVVLRPGLELVAA